MNARRNPALVLAVVIGLSLVDAVLSVSILALPPETPCVQRGACPDEPDAGARVHAEAVDGSWFGVDTTANWLTVKEAHDAGLWAAPSVGGETLVIGPFLRGYDDGVTIYVPDYERIPPGEYDCVLKRRGGQ